MKMTNYLLLIALITTFSCSMGSKKDRLLKVTNLFASEADFIVDADDEELTLEDGTVVAEGEDQKDEMNVSALDDAMASSPALELGSEEGQYTVKRGETLMMIAFNVYGDYSKWRLLSDLNGLRGHQVREGAVIRYRKPVEEFVWNPEDYLT